MTQTVIDDRFRLDSLLLRQPPALRIGDHLVLWEATRLSTERQVVVALPRANANRVEAAAAIQTLLDLLGRLRHPNLPRLVDEGEDPQAGPYLAIDTGGGARWRAEWTRSAGCAPTPS